VLALFYVQVVTLLACRVKHGWLNGRMHGWRDDCIDGWMAGCVRGWLDGWMHEYKSSHHKDYNFELAHCCAARKQLQYVLAPFH